MKVRFLQEKEFAIWILFRFAGRILTKTLIFNRELKTLLGYLMNNNKSGYLQLISLFLCLQAQMVCAQTLTTFSFTGNAQTFTVPHCVTTISVDARGAEGGLAYPAPTLGVPGKGGRITAIITVTPGQVLQINVGDAGANGTPSLGGVGGFNGGGSGGAAFSGPPSGGGGGGASDIRYFPYTLFERIVVAGAGGGSCTDDPPLFPSNSGGDGGDTLGENGYKAGANRDFLMGIGGGGGQSYGGVGGNWYWSVYCAANSGSLGIGGSVGTCTKSGAGGGGGGGYYGGGAGGYSGGGGGSSYAIPGAASITHTQGAQIGNGLIIISYKEGIVPMSLTTTPAYLCAGATATMAGSGATTYSWSTGSNSSSIIITPNSTTGYSVGGMSIHGCTLHNTFTVQVNSAPPVISVTSNTNQICLGDVITLNASGGITNTWSGGVVNGVPFKPVANSIYTATAINGCGTASASISISVTPLAVTASASHSLVCQLNTVTMTATGGSLYKWLPVASTASAVFINPAANNIYTVTASDGPCIGSATVAVHTTPNPTISIIASPTVICAGESLTISASGATTYSWANASIAGSNGTVAPFQSIIYSLTGSNQFGCTAKDSIAVIVNPTPHIMAASSMSVMCAGDNATLTVSGNAHSYSWNTGSNATLITVSPGVTSSYTVTGNDTLSGCKVTKSLTVTVTSTVLPVSASSTICTGNSITLFAGGINHTWSPVQSNFPQISVSPTSATTYSVFASHVNNNVTCPASNTVHVGLHALPVVALGASSIKLCSATENITLTANGAASYLWLHNKATGSTIKFKATQAKIYDLVVIGTDTNGCKDSANILIEVERCVGLREMPGAKGLINIYPNPAKSSVTIQSTLPLECSLYNDLGQVLRRNTMNVENNFTLHLETLPSGIYFVTVMNDGIVLESRKLIIIR